MNVVAKATSRRRGAAKTVRAAQRTALPGDAVTAQVKDAKPGAPVDVSKLDKMSLGELRQLGHALGFSTALKASKAELVRVIRANPAGPPKGARKAQAEPADDVGSKPSARVNAKRAAEIGARMLAERKRFTRGLLADAAGQTPSIIWRWEKGRPRPDELHIIDALFAKIDAGELTAPEKRVSGQSASGPKAALVSTVEQVRHVLSDVPATGLKVGQAREAISTCLDLIEKTLSSGDE